MCVSFSAGAVLLNRLEVDVAEKSCFPQVSCAVGFVGEPAHVCRE